MLMHISSVRSKASENFQFIVISLKNSFWERAAGLVGVWRDVEARSSKVLTLDVGSLGSRSMIQN